MCKNFIQNIGFKEHITAVHEKRDSIVINVAKILLEDAIWNSTLNSIVITMAKTSKLLWIRQNTGLKLQITAVHENEKIKFWSMWQKFC